jgi:hypothetical protein
LCRVSVTSGTIMGLVSRKVGRVLRLSGWSRLAHPRCEREALGASSACSVDATDKLRICKRLLPHVPETQNCTSINFALQPFYRCQLIVIDHLDPQKIDAYGWLMQGKASKTPMRPQLPDRGAYQSLISDIRVLPKVTEAWSAPRVIAWAHNWPVCFIAAPSPSFASFGD